MNKTSSLDRRSGIKARCIFAEWELPSGLCWWFAHQFFLLSWVLPSFSCLYVSMSSSFCFPLRFAHLCEASILRHLHHTFKEHSDIQINPALHTWLCSHQLSYRLPLMLHGKASWSLANRQWDGIRFSPSSSSLDHIFDLCCCFVMHQVTAQLIKEAQADLAEI